MLMQKTHSRFIFGLFTVLTTALTGCQTYKSNSTLTNLSSINKTPNLDAQTAYSHCVAKSQYKHPQISGHLIETPLYMLITLINQPHVKKSQGELCILNKQLNTIELTPVNDLRFLNK